MSMALTQRIAAALSEFSSTRRLYELVIGDGRSGPPAGSLLVEAFVASDGLQEVGVRDIIVLSTSMHIDLDSLLGKPAALEVCRADGKRERYGGEICEVAMLGSDGGLARYRIGLSPWIWRLGQVRNSRVWQDKRVTEIVDAVFAGYRPLARWCWSSDTGPFLRDTLPRSYCCQYRESDLDFVRRILAEEGLGWRIEQGADGPMLVLFGNSSHPRALPEDLSSAASGSVRYHAARAVEQDDTVQALTMQRHLQAALTRCSAMTTRPGRSSQGARQRVSRIHVIFLRLRPSTCRDRRRLRRMSRRGTTPICRWKGGRRAPNSGRAVRRCAPCGRERG